MPEEIQPQVQEEVNNQPVTKSKSDFLTKIAFFIFWSLLGLVLITLLDGLLHSLDQIRFTPREQFSFDFSHQLEALRLFGVWIIGVLAVGSLITYFVSKSARLSRVALILIATLTIGFSALAYFVSLQPCEGLGCIGIGFSLWFAEAWLFIAAGSLPILYMSSSKEISLAKNKRFWLSGLVVLLGISILWFFTTSYIRGESAKKVSTAKSEIQQVYSDPNFPVFEPSYLPPSVGEVGHEWVADRQSSVEYIRWYLYGGCTCFEISQEKSNVPQTPNDYLGKDISEINKTQEIYADDDTFTSSYEMLTINEEKAFYYSEKSNFGRENTLYLYPEGVRIKLSVNISQAQLSKEQLIKIAESLKKVN